MWASEKEGKIDIEQSHHPHLITAGQPLSAARSFDFVKSYLSLEKRRRRDRPDL